MSHDPPEPKARYRFFAGKGGVGKTTCAAAAALALAEGMAGGEAVLVASTDPAHSLGDALGRRLGPDPRPVPGRGKTGALWAVELSGERAFSRWLEPRRAALRAAALRGTYLDEEDVDRLLALSPPGVDEIAALLDLERAVRETGCAEVVVDTAPTAHTLRLVATPEVLTRIATLLDGLQEKHRQIAQHFGSGYRPDRVDAALGEIEAEGRGLAALLADRERTRFVWLLLPEALSLAEAKDGVAALKVAGIAVDEVIVNRVTPPGDLCASCGERRRAELAVIAAAAAAFPDHRLRLLPALGREPRGVAGLRRVGKALADPAAGRDLLVEPVEPSKPSKKTPVRRQSSRPSRRPEWPGLLAPPGVRLLLFGGKGGVGKTTCAATAALALAAERPEERLLLLSTDPAHSLGDVLDVPLADDLRQLSDGPPNLWARELDAARALERWGESSGDESSGDRREAIEGLLAAFFGPPGDREAREEIAAPLSGVTPSGLDELMAILALAEALFQDAYDLVVVDLAPTGHALRLLEMPALALTWDRALLALLLKYREAVRPGVLAAELVELSRTLNRLAARLADPGRTRFVPVARAAELPRRETARLLAALKRLGIATAPLLINAVANPGCDRCQERKDAEERELDRLRALVGGTGGSAILLAPARYPPPRGITVLSDWGRSWRRSTP